MDEELAAGSSPESGGQWLNIQMEMGGKWCPSGMSVLRLVLGLTSYQWYEQGHLVHPQQVCGWHQAVVCGQHAQGTRCHLERPRPT